MANTKTTICNMALTYLAGNLLDDIDTDTTTEADLCNANWDSCRDFVLEARDWTFARVRDELTKDATAPDFEWGSRFAKPSDCLVLRRVARQAANMEIREPFELEGNWILADVDTLYVIYTAQITDVTLFSPAFVRALAYYLASTLAPALSENVKQAQLLYQQFERVLDQAGGRDGVQSMTRRTQTPTFVRKRSLTNRWGEFY